MPILADDFCLLFPVFCRANYKSHLAAILGLLESRQLPAGQVLIQENKPSQSIYLLVDGTLDVITNAGGQQERLGSVKKGGIVGEITILDGEPEPASIVAQTDCTVLALSEDNLKKLDKQNPAASTHLLRSLSHVMSDRIRAATDLILPLLDSEEASQDFDTKLETAYASLYGLGGKS